MRTHFKKCEVRNERKERCEKKLMYYVNAMYMYMKRREDCKQRVKCEWFFFIKQIGEGDLNWNIWVYLWINFYTFSWSVINAKSVQKQKIKQNGKKLIHLPEKGIYVLYFEELLYGGFINVLLQRQFEIRLQTTTWNLTVVCGMRL